MHTSLIIKKYLQEYFKSSFLYSLELKSLATKLHNCTEKTISYQHENEFFKLRTRFSRVKVEVGSQRPFRTTSQHPLPSNFKLLCRPATRKQLASNVLFMSIVQCSYFEIIFFPGSRMNVIHFMDNESESMNGWWTYYYRIHNNLYIFFLIRHNDSLIENRSFCEKNTKAYYNKWFEYNIHIIIILTNKNQT